MGNELAGSNPHLTHSLPPGGDGVNHNHRPEPQMDRPPEQVCRVHKGVCGGRGEPEDKTEALWNTAPG